MPSTVVHVGLAGLVGTALLAEHFDKKTVLVVMAATAVLDLDVFVGMVIPGTHRAAFHTLLLPGLAGAVVGYDLRVRGRSWLRGRWGPRGVRAAWVSIVAATLAGIGPDLFFNGANVFYPLYDRFYDLSGKVLYSTERGFVQTIVQVDLSAILGDPAGPDPGSGSGSGGGSDPAPTTENTHYRTGVDPARGDEPENVERLFPIAMTGERFLLAASGYAVVAARLRLDRRNR